MFWITFAVFNVTNIIYVIWASGETQPFNTPHLVNKHTGQLERAIDSNNEKSANNTKMTDEFKAANEVKINS